MQEKLISLWLFLTHWVRLDVMDSQEELDDTLELLQRQSLPVKVRTRKNEAGAEEYVLYVNDADRDYARYCTGWRPE